MGQLRRLYSVLRIDPCHTTALAQGFIFQSAVRLQKKTDIFRENGPVTASLQRHSDYGVDTELAWRSIACLPYGVLVGDSQPSHDAFIALSRCSQYNECTALSRVLTAC